MIDGVRVIAPVTDDDPGSASGSDGHALTLSNLGIGEPATPPSSVLDAAREQLMGLAGRARQALATAPGHNPGHTVMAHAGGSFSASSSAPRNPRQHLNVAPPSHQRHDPGEHPSAARALLALGPDLVELL